MKFLALFLFFPIAVMALQSPGPRPVADASELSNSLFTSTVATFAAIVSQSRETEANELRATLDSILPIRGLISGNNGRRGVIFDRLIVWEGSTIPSSYLGVFSRIYIVEDITDAGISIKVQGSTEEENVDFVLPVSLREPLISVNP